MGQRYGYDPTHIHAVDTVAGADRYDYDLNGSMTVRNKGTASRQDLKWDSHNRLAQVTGSGVDESYLYDENGVRIRKTNSLTGVGAFYPVAGYEQTSSGAVTEHYSFGGRLVAVRNPGGALSFLCEVAVSSTVYVTDVSANERLLRFQARRRASTATGSPALIARWYPAPTR